jgi:RND family efflux transporter MFP subunit
VLPEENKFASIPPDDGHANGAANPSVDDAADESADEDLEPKAGTGWKLIAFAVLLLAALGIGFFLVQHRRSDAEADLAKNTAAEAAKPPAVNVIHVQPAPPSHTISLPAETSAWYQTTIYARVNGYVKQFNVDIGDHVKAGQLLAQIETPELDQQLAAAQAKVDAVDAQIKVAQSDVHFADVTLNRYKDAPRGVVSELERDQRASDSQASAAKLSAAQSDLASANAEVDRLKTLIGFQKVIAPFDGVITERHVNLGDLVTSGSTSNTSSLFELAQFDTMRVYVDVPQASAFEIHVGDPGSATCREFPGRVFGGKVARTASAFSNASKTMRVELDIPNKDLTLVPGMYVMAECNVDSPRPELQIPAAALVFRSGGPAVAVVDADNRVSFHAVTIGRDMGSTVQIAKGLNADDVVAMNISNQITDGDTVTPVEERAANLKPATTATASTGE